MGDTFMILDLLLTKAPTAPLCWYVLITGSNFEGWIYLQVYL